jgi:hypothetical protein
MVKGLRDLPSLDLLKGFEAAARNLSFTKAAAELFVTQSAVSRQIQALEDQLGVPLFRRSHRELRLTEEGQTLYKTSAEVMRLLRDVAGRLRGRPGMLTVTTTASFAALWLVSRLNDFRRLHAGIDMRLDVTNEIQDPSARGHRRRHPLLHAQDGGRTGVRLRRAGVSGVLEGPARRQEARRAQGPLGPGAVALRRSLPALPLAVLGGVVRAHPDPGTSSLRACCDSRTTIR